MAIATLELTIYNVFFRNDLVGTRRTSNQNFSQIVLKFSDRTHPQISVTIRHFVKIIYDLSY